MAGCGIRKGFDMELKKDLSWKEVALLVIVIGGVWAVVIGYTLYDASLKAQEMEKNARAAHPECYSCLDTEKELNRQMSEDDLKTITRTGNCSTECSVLTGLIDSGDAIRLNH